MRFEQDYRTNVRLSLKIMKEQRAKLNKDSKEHYSTIYNGLHESESVNVRNLYFQAYEMEWLDSHWCALAEYLKHHDDEFSKDEQRDITLFFAEYFSSFMAELENSSCLAKTAAPELIRSQQKVLEQMIQFSGDWEERSNQLKVNLKKHKEHFKRLVENAQKRGG